MTLLILPDPGPWATTPVVQRSTLNASATSASDQQLSVAAENAPLRVIYGQVRLGPQIACVLGYNGALVILCIWGHGEVDSFVSLDLDDLPLPGGVAYTHYTGTAGQTVDATLVAAFAAQSPAVIYTDALPGICYTVATAPAGSSSGFPRFNAVINGLKVWTGSVSEWSDNPAFCTADFVTNTVYGMGRTVDWTSVASVAADNDVLAGGTEKLRTLNLALDTVQPALSWLDTLRTYACCWVMPSATGMKFVSDKAGTPVGGAYAAGDYFAEAYNYPNTGEFIHGLGNIQSLTSLKKSGVQSMPTVMTITYTDTSTTPYRDATAVVYASGVLAGTTPRRESQVSLPGVNRYSQAYREATERLNKLLLNDLSLNLAVFDDALVLEVGDIVSVTHPRGLTAKLLRVMGVTGGYGDYSLNLVEYDPAVYSASVVSAPTYVDTMLPNPAAPPTIAGVTMTEEVFQLENGNWSSRWRITWTAATYSYLANYRAELWAGSTLIQVASPKGAEWPTAAVKEGVNYTAKVAAVSSIGSSGSWGSQSGVALGKSLIPGNVPSVSAFEAGGRVYVSWTPAIDIDIWRYEVRYGAVAGTWATSILLDRVDALRLQTDQIPTGSWTIYIKAIDSVQQYSTTAATVNVTVTSDASSFLVASYDQTAPTLTNMVEYKLARDDINRYFVSEDAVLWNTKFSAGLNTYTNPLATYHSSMTSTWLGESEDYGLLLGGNWTGTATVADVSGTHISYLGNSTDGSTWTYPSGLTQKVNSRFARMKHEALTTATLLVTIPTQNIRIDAVPREETFTGTSSATGPKTVYLANDFIVTKKITISVLGSTAASHTEDNIGHNAPNQADAGANIVVTGSVITLSAATGTPFNLRAKHALPTGKSYWETKVNSAYLGGPSIGIGIGNAIAGLSGAMGGEPNNWAYINDTGLGRYNAATVFTGATYTTGDVIGCAFDSAAQTLQVFKNNTSQGTFTGITGVMFPEWSLNVSTDSLTAITQSAVFSYAPPTGFLPLPYAFNEYIFDTSGALITRDFIGSYQGV